MRLYIPTIGATLVLAEPWTITVYNERRNSTLLKALGKSVDYYRNGYGKPVMTHTFPEGTLLNVARIYIRDGSSEYDSVTFRAISPKGKGRVRFWAKLDEVNRMVIRGDE